jgi:hypothetical protein
VATEPALADCTGAVPAARPRRTMVMIASGYRNGGALVALSNRYRTLLVGFMPADRSQPAGGTGLNSNSHRYSAPPISHTTR